MQCKALLLSFGHQPNPTTPGQETTNAGAVNARVVTAHHTTPVWGWRSEEEGEGSPAAAGKRRGRAGRGSFYSVSSDPRPSLGAGLSAVD